MLILPWFDSILSPNNKAHWRAKNKPKQLQRDAGFYIASEAGIPPKQDTYHLKIIFHPPDRKHRDLDNCLASIKAALDGVSKAWRINDKDFRPITIDFGGVVKHGKITIEVEGA